MLVGDTDAARAAGKELSIPLRWGGAWHVSLTDTDEPPEDLLADYVKKVKKAGKKPFLDGVHFELPQTAVSINKRGR